MIFNYDSLSFGILTAERVSHENGLFSVKERPFAALSFRISGTGTFYIDKKRLVANAGDVLFIPANKPYEVEYSFSEFIVVHLPCCNYTEAECINAQGKENIPALFLKLLGMWNTARSVNLAKSYVYEILHELSQSNISKDSERPKEFERCLSYLEENFCNSDVSIESLCHFGYISRSSLQRYFLRYLGVSPKQYLLRLRLGKAVDLLANDSKPIADVAEACGFSDEKYFSRIFKQTYGLSPSDARHRTHI